MKELLLVAGIHWLAVMSPGPDFAMVLRNSMVYSRRTGILAAFGLGCGILLHVTYSLLGIGFIISQSILLFNVIKLLGAAYLIYIGIKSLLSKKSTHPLEGDEPIETSGKGELSDWEAIRLGFLTNALNPKATMFFLALFTQVIQPTTPLWLKSLYGAEMAIATFVWFALVATVMSHRNVTKIFSGIKHHVERVFGVVLIALGVKVALGTQK